MSDIVSTPTPTPAQADRSLAYRHRPGKTPTTIFLPGYMSDMEGTKALALDDWAQRTKRAFLRFDYGGCGASGGDFATQTLGDWRDDVLAMIDQVAEGPVVLVGSSMGGWLMLHAALARPDRVAGLVGIAAAPDFTDWGFSQDEKMTILREGRLERPSPYDESVMIVTRPFWESGEAMRLLPHGEIAIDCAVRLLHGQQDAEVSWTYTLELAKRLRSADVQTFLVKDGTHRMSREQDLALLLLTVELLLEAV
jgi:pimeloyl-ACP methyl ester carboxylesterase